MVHVYLRCWFGFFSFPCPGAGTKIFHNCFRICIFTTKGLWFINDAHKTTLKMLISQWVLSYIFVQVHTVYSSAQINQKSIPCYTPYGKLYRPHWSLASPPWQILLHKNCVFFLLPAAAEDQDFIFKNILKCLKCLCTVLLLWPMFLM